MSEISPDNAQGAPIAPRIELGTDQAATVTETPSTGFLDTLSEELRDIPALRTFKDVESLAKSYVHAQGLLGKKIQEMTPDELNAAFGRMNGAPESVDGYDLKAEMDPDTLVFFKKLSHELKLSPAQAAQLVGKFEKIDRNTREMTIKEKEQAKLDAINILKDDYGKHVDDKIKLAKKAIAELGGPDLVEDLELRGLLNDPKLIKAFVKAGEGLLESDLVGTTGLGSFSMTPEQARRARDQKLMSNEFREAYFNERHPAHKGAVAEMNELYEIIWPASIELAFLA